MPDSEGFDIYAWAKAQPTAALFAAAQTEQDDEVRLPAMRSELVKRNDALQMPLEFVHSSNPDQRAFGLEILCRFGVHRPDLGKPFFEECVDMSIQCLHDQAQVVVTAAAWALRQLGGPRSSSALIQLRTHMDAEIRVAVIMGIGQNCSHSPEIIETWLYLMDDPDDDVRDWATFSVGSLSEESSPKIIAALLNRLEDPFKPAREEAIWGLASRRHIAGLEILVARFETDVWVNGDTDAAEQALVLKNAAPEELLAGLRNLLAQSQHI